MCSFVFGLVIIVTVAMPQSGAQPPMSPPPRANPLPANPLATEVRIGLPDVLFKDVHPTLVDIAARPFKEMIQKTLGMDGSLIKAKDYQVLANQLKARQVDIALFHGFEYAWIKEQDIGKDLIPLVVTLPNCGKVQACLVVNVASTATLPKDVKGVAIHKGSKAHCQMFLDRLREGLPADRCCPLEVKGTLPTPEEVLENVASGCGNCEAALVDISSLLAYKRDKPGLGSCLKVLTQSELLPAAVIVCRKDAFKQSQMDAITKGLLECTKTPAGRMFVMFWNLKGFGLWSDEYRELVDKTLKAYPPPVSPKK
jgi:ABC-type phosphate/phosphonate transport system substrate-binding protein